MEEFFMKVVTFFFLSRIIEKTKNEKAVFSPLPAVNCWICL